MTHEDEKRMRGKESRGDWSDNLKFETILWTCSLCKLKWFYRMKRQHIMSKTCMKEHNKHISLQNIIFSTTQSVCFTWNYRASSRPWLDLKVQHMLLRSFWKACLNLCVLHQLFPSRVSHHPCCRFLPEIDQPEFFFKKKKKKEEWQG